MKITIARIVCARDGGEIRHRTMAELTNEHMMLTLEEYGYRRMPTARALGLSIRTLRNYIQAWRRDGVTIPRSPDGGSKK